MKEFAKFLQIEKGRAKTQTHISDDKVLAPSRKLVRYLRTFFSQWEFFNLRTKHFTELGEAKSSLTYVNKVAAYTNTGLSQTISLKMTEVLKMVWWPEKKEVKNAKDQKKGEFKANQDDIASLGLIWVI